MLRHCLPCSVMSPAQWVFRSPLPGLPSAYCVRGAHLVHNMSPLNEQFNITLERWAQAVRDFSSAAGDPLALATGQLYQQMIVQARILAYVDVFIGLGIVAFVLIPLCFLLSPVKSEGSAGAH